MNGIDRHCLRNAEWKQPALQAAMAVAEPLRSFDTEDTEHMFLKTLIIIRWYTSMTHTNTHTRTYT